MRALATGEPRGIRVEAAAAIERRAVEDGSGDTLDALICAVQAAWGWRRKASNFGLPDSAPPGEGWIVTS
jgi:predicted RNase H-like nuclease